ncbi:VanZ family protein [Paucibacter sp. AS339]|uniref:VanZ family protein n=1 Tax=Paucibacter hankyongi TaxID=3133434 RepID=UPI003095FC3F
MLCVWVIFLVYGSLLPLEFRSLSLGDVSSQFLGLSQSVREIKSWTDWITNIAIFVPVGFLGLATFSQVSNIGKKLAGGLWVMTSATLLSLCIEFAQLFVPPRDSSILDVIANSMGTALGLIAWLLLGDITRRLYQVVAQQHYTAPNLPHKRAPHRLVGIACLLLIAVWAGFFTRNWVSFSEAGARWQALRFAPFLQHQAADINLALLSTIFALAAYMPIGIWRYWVDRHTGQLRSIGRHLRRATLLASALALVVEVTKLFLTARSPDSGNIVIASLAACLGYFFAPLMIQSGRSQPLAADSISSVAASSPRSPTKNHALGWVLGRSASLLSTVGAIAIVITYPIGQFMLGAALLAYAGLLLRVPRAWLVVLPALLPILDLAPWTGRFFIDEFDAFVLVTLAVGLWQAAGQPLVKVSGRIFRWSAGIFVASYLLSSVIGLFPLQTFDGNAFASLYSHFSSLRMGKGMVFAIGLAMLFSSLVAKGQDAARTLCTGMILGLAAACATVIWERLAYVGLSDFNGDFRVVGLFSTMHTGGAHLDAFLLLSLPFAAVWGLRTKHTAMRAAAGLLFAAGVYAVMMTFARAAVAALLLSMLTVSTWMLLSTVGANKRGQTISGLKLAAGLALAMLVIAPVLWGSFMQSRLANTDADMGTRTSHWSEALGMMTDNWGSQLFGMGLGRYPESYMLLSSNSDKPALNRYELEGSNGYLSIRHGATLYVDQIVFPKPSQDYVVRLTARTHGKASTLNVLLCDRTFLQGFACQSSTFHASGSTTQWQHFEAHLNSGAVGQHPLRISKISLENSSPATSIDVDDLSIVDDAGIDLIRNGGFQNGGDHWFPSSPYNHLPWHIKNLWLAVFFEQGWLGLLSIFSLTVAACIHLSQRAWPGDAFAASLLAAVLGFFVVGGFDSVFDAPRLTMLFGLLIAAAGFSPLRKDIALAAARDVDRATQVPPSLTLKPTFAAPSDSKLLNLPSSNAAMSPALTPSPATLPSGLPWRRSALTLLIGIMLLAMGIAVVVRLPFVPYNIRELPNEYHPVLAPIALSAFLFWAFGLPALGARWMSTARGKGAFYPALLALHALLGWALLQFAVLPESIHDVIGSPILGWPGQAEYVYRFIPLLSLFTLMFTGGAILAATLSGARIGLAGLWWILSALFLLPLQYHVIVLQAATDNLVELIAGRGSAEACAPLLGYLLLIACIGSLLASRRRIAWALVGTLISLPVGYLLLVNGTEPLLVQHNRAFSALQFLLSADREHYVTGPALWGRFAVAHLSIIALIAMTQTAIWSSFPRPKQRRAHGRSRPIERSTGNS